ncbi:MAG: adenylate/guanylate cyclase domain-containing protein [Flavobacteriaceae bacterium]
MSFSVRQKRKIRIAATIIIAGNALGIFYVLWSDGFGSLFPYINTVTIATLIGLVISVFELQVVDEKMRNIRFVPLLIIRTAVYVVLIPLIILLELMTARVIKFGLSYKEVYYSDEFQNYLFNEDFSILLVYVVALAFLINFIYQISRKMGQGIMLNFITGKYKNPVKEERIIMFMHVSNSQEIINKIGSIRFLEFLNRILFDITESILLYRGIIYEYVEDECVVSWKLEQGVKEANCLLSVLDIIQKMEVQKKSYLAEFEVFPELEIAFHYGLVLQAEVGTIKSKVAFYGDVMNITARMLGKCKELGKQVLMSAELEKLLQIPAHCNAESLGIISLRGKSEPIELFTLSTTDFQ